VFGHDFAWNLRWLGRQHIAPVGGFIVGTVPIKT
jgi:hypothetical protein